MATEKKSPAERLADDSRLTVDEAREVIDAKRQEIDEKMDGDMDAARRDRIAFQMAQSDRLAQERTGRGEEMEVDILAIGHRGRIEEWGQNNVEMVYAHGIVFGPLGDDDQTQAGLAVFLHDESTGVDLGNVMDQFSMMNELHATYSVASTEIDGCFECWSTGRTVVEEDEVSALSDRTDEEKRDFLRQCVPETTIAELPDNLSRVDPESDYPVAYGVDLRRIECNVVDAYRADDSERGSYTVMDHTVTADDVVGSKLFANENGPPGVTAWSDKSQIEYGQESQIEIYGVAKTNRDGDIVIQHAGSLPIFPKPYGGDEDADEGVSAQKSEL